MPSEWVALPMVGVLLGATRWALLKSWHLRSDRSS